MITRTEEGSLELWLEMVRGIVGRPTEGLTLLDLCCGECTGTAKLPWRRHTGIDVVDWDERAPSVNFHKLTALPALEITLPKHFDVCICSDGIEHLTKTEGLELLVEMKRVATLSIIFTPIGPWKLDADATHPDTHKSAWTPEELETMGWDVIAFPNWHATLKVGAFFASKDKLNDNDKRI